MTVIVRYDNKLYFDDLLLTANHIGGTFAGSIHPKVYKHENYNALIGVSGGVPGNIFNQLNAVITQWLTELKIDKHAPLSMETLDDIASDTLLTIGIYCRDFTIVMHTDGDGKKKDWSVYKHPLHRTMIIGSGVVGMHFHEQLDKAMRESEEAGLTLLIQRDVYASCNWKKLNIESLGEL